MQEKSLSGTRLRDRLLQVILPAVILPLLAASAVGYRIISQRTESRVQQQLADQSLLASEGTTAVLEELLDLPRSIADNPLVVNEAKAGSAEAAAAGLNQRPIEALEAEFAETKLLRRHNALNAYLERTVETTEISEISVTERHGFNVAYSHPTTDFVQSDEAWWKNGQANQQWIGPPDFDYASKGFTVELVQAIRDPLDDSFVGMVRAVLPTRKFSLLADYLKRTGISGSQRVQLVDGSTLKTIDTFSPQGFLKDRDILGGEPVSQMITAFVESTPAASDQEPNPEQVLSALKAVPEAAQVSLPLFDENAQLASFTTQNRQYKMAKIPNSNWVAVASMDESEISAQGRDSLLFFSLFTLLLSGLTTGLIVRLARQLSAPLGRLTQQAEAIASGNFDLTAEPTGTAETRFLTQTFNQLTGQVKGLLQDQRRETQKAQLFAMITGSRVHQISDLERVLAESLQGALEILQAGRMAFCQINPNLLGEQPGLSKPVMWKARSPQLALTEANLGPADWLPANLPTAEAAESPIVLNNIVFDEKANAQAGSSHRSFLQAAAVRSSLSVPVLVEREMESETDEAQIWGYLIAHHCDQAHVWQPDEVSFVQQMAAQLELVAERISATENVRRSRSETQVSRLTAQRSQLATEALTREQQQQVEAQRRQEASLQQQIAALTQDIEGVFKGDLTVRARVHEGKLLAIADVFNVTVAKLQELVTQVQHSTAQVDSFFSQNEQMAAQLAGATQQQQQETQRTLETIRSVSRSMESVISSTQTASEIAHQTAVKAQASEVAIEQTSRNVALLNRLSTNASNQIDQLTRSTDNVAYMTAMIAEIATNLKSLSQQANFDLGGWGGTPTPAQVQQISQVMVAIDKLADKAISEAGLIDTFLTSVGKTTEQVIDEVHQINQQISDSSQAVAGAQQNLSEVRQVSRQFEQSAQSVSQAAQAQNQVSQTAAELIEAVVGLSMQTTQASQEMAESLQSAIATTRELQASVSAFKVGG
jgi:methyl-accepting chemotaxis protein PixJ